MGDTARSARIRSLRPPRPQIDPAQPLAVEIEEERGFDGQLDRCVTVFLAGSECPFTCNFCDLWRYTVEGPTPPGAIPRQLESALARLQTGEQPAAIKLYNASNFFDQRAIPKVDYPAIAALVSDFERVIVECHPRLVGEHCARFAARLHGNLEIAMGLETVHAQALPRLNKRMTLEDFELALVRLQTWRIDTRAFALLSPPFVPAGEQIEWAVQTVRWALDRGVRVVSLIPVRLGNGELERLAATDQFHAADLPTFEEAMCRATELGKGVVLADLWDVERLACCEACRQARIERLLAMNRTGVPPAAIACRRCENSNERLA